MKAALRLIPLFAFVGMMLPAHAADLSGAWKGAFDFNGQSIPVSINLKADGVTLTGSIEGLPTTPTDIHDGKIAGDTVTFWANTDYEGQTYKLVFTGKTSGDQIDFTFGTDDGTFSTTLTVKREGAPAPATARRFAFRCSRRAGYLRHLERRFRVQRQQSAGYVQLPVRRRYHHRQCRRHGRGSH